MTAIAERRQASRLLPRLLMAPAIGTLFLWMIVPLGMTIYFSLIRYNLMQPGHAEFVGAQPIDFMSDWPLLAVIIMVAWQWLPFACLIFITALASMNREQLEAARMDGAGYLQQLRHMYLPHLARSIAVVIMIELI